MTTQLRLAHMRLSPELAVGLLPSGQHCLMASAVSAQVPVSPITRLIFPVVDAQLAHMVRLLSANFFGHEVMLTGFLVNPKRAYCKLSHLSGVRVPDTNSLGIRAASAERSAAALALALQELESPRATLTRPTALTSNYTLEPFTNPEPMNYRLTYVSGFAASQLLLVNILKVRIFTGMSTMPPSSRDKRPFLSSWEHYNICWYWPLTSLRLRIGNYAALVKARLCRLLSCQPSLWLCPLPAAARCRRQRIRSP